MRYAIYQKPPKAKQLYLVAGMYVTASEPGQALTMAIDAVRGLKIVARRVRIRPCPEDHIPLDVIDHRRRRDPL